MGKVTLTDFAPPDSEIYDGSLKVGARTTTALPINSEKNTAGQTRKNMPYDLENLPFDPALKAMESVSGKDNREQ